MEPQNRTLFFGDNLEILEGKLPKDFFDLIYLDPPFNSNRNYNVLFKEGKVDSSAQIHAFQDTWEWTDATIQLYDNLRQSVNPQITILIESLHQFLGDTPMMAYLVNMIARLTPLRNALKETGSIYLHCDPTASHYLKVSMDVIFGKEKFVNEIIWKRTSAHSDTTQGAKHFGRSHDTILYYRKSNENNSIWNSQYTPYTKDYIETYYKYIDEKGRRYWADNLTAAKPGGDTSYEWKGIKPPLGRYWAYSKAKMEKMDKEGRILYSGTSFPKYKRYLDEMPGRPVQDIWDDIKGLGGFAGSKTERLGYPTQKPETLLERIIRTSSNEGDWILDPFCGCGTAVAVAEHLGRNWVGIDISMLAVNVISQRMKAHFPGIDITIDGIPQDYTAAVALAEKDKFAFQDWAITLVGASPPAGETKKGADRGVDGLILFRDHIDTESPKLKKILVQVKGGHHSRNDIATLKGDIDRDNAPMGIFICLNEPSREMKREAMLSGSYKYSDSVEFPKIQILSIKDWFDGKKVNIPSTKVNPFGTAEVKVDQKTIF